MIQGPAVQVWLHVGPAPVHRATAFVTESPPAMNASGDTDAFLLEHRRSLKPVDSLPDALYPGSEAAAYGAWGKRLRQQSGPGPT